MALPFIAGLAVGAGAALLFTKRKEIQKVLDEKEVGKNLKKGFNQSIEKGKKISSNALKYTKSEIESVTKNLKGKVLKKRGRPRKNPQQDTTQTKDNV